MKGIGTKEKELTNVFCNRPHEYLQDLRAAYYAAHRLDLLTRVRLETSGQYQRLFEALLGVKAELRADYVHEAVSGAGTNEMLLIDCILTCDSLQMDELKRAYKEHHAIPLQARCDFETSGVFQKLLDANLAGSRPENGIRTELVDQDLITLFNATEGKTIGTDENAIIGLIQQRSDAHLVYLNAAYKQKSKKGRTFVEEIVAKQHGYAERAFVAHFLGPAGWTAFRLNMECRGHIKADFEGLIRSIFMPTQKELKSAMRILLQVYKVDLHDKLSKFFFGGEIRDALMQYVDYVQTNAKDSGERAVIGDGSQEWVDPNVPTPSEGHAQKLPLTRNQKIAIGVGIGVGVAALAVGGGILAYQVHKKNEEKKAAAGGTDDKGRELEVGTEAPAAAAPTETAGESREFTF